MRPFRIVRDLLCSPAGRKVGGPDALKAWQERVSDAVFTSRAAQYGNQVIHCAAPECNMMLTVTPSDAEAGYVECHSACCRGMPTCITHQELYSILTLEWSSTAALFIPVRACKSCGIGAPEEARLSAATIELECRPCPKCHAQIQRDGGCRHMTCRCTHEFFWCCLRAYRNPDEHRAHLRECP